MKMMYQARLVTAALLVLGPMSANAELVTWEFNGEIDEVIGSSSVSLGDNFRILVSFDTNAPLERAQTGGRFGAGTRYEYDASGVTFLVSLEGQADQSVSPLGDGFDLLWLRDNSADRSCCEFPEVDGLTFALLDADAFGMSVILRGSILDIFNSGALPTDPDPRLVGLEITVFQWATEDGIASGQILSINQSSVSKTVTIDIKPGSDPNCFNVNGHGVIPVAVLGSDTFDVTNIDQSSLLFGGLEVRIRGKKGPLCNIDYSNGDAYLDLICHFEDDAANWSVGSENATLLGTLFDGSEFEGTDSICVVP